MKKNINFRIILFSFVFAQTLSILAAINIKADTLNDCDSYFAERGELLFTAAKCYQSIPVAQDVTAENLFERSFIALSVAVDEFSENSYERDAIDEALVILENVKTSVGETPFYNYWKAVWISFDAVEKDRGDLLPTTMFGRISTIQNLLASAIKDAPQTHFYGPQRVLGLMHTRMPRIAGGDKKYAESLLSAAYTSQSNYFSNPYAYANILFLNGKNEAAKTVLNDFINKDNNYYEVFSTEPLRSFAKEIQAEKIKAQKLLLEIESD